MEGVVAVPEGDPQAVPLVPLPGTHIAGTAVPVIGDAKALSLAVLELALIGGHTAGLLGAAPSPGLALPQLT